MNIKESFKQIEKLAEALPALAALAEPLAGIESLAQLEEKIAASQSTLDRIEDAIRASKVSQAESEDRAESARKAAAKMAASIADKAFEESKPRREAIEAEIAELEAKSRHARGGLIAAQVATEAKKTELADLEARISLVKAEAVKALGI